MLAIIALAAAFLLVSRSLAPESAVATDSPSKAQAGTSAYISMAFCERAGLSIGEIAMIFIEAPMATAEINKINKDIKNDVSDRYSDFIRTQTGSSWAEAKSYPFTSDRYLQIVMTYIEYPSRSTDGEIYSYVYDRQENLYISLATVLKEQGLPSADSFQKKAQELFRPAEGSLSRLGTAVAKGFWLPPEGGVEILFEGVVLNGPDPPWSHFFALSLEKGEVRQLNSEILFSPGDMDKFDPPLFYQASAVEIASPEEALSFPTK